MNLYRFEILRSEADLLAVRDDWEALWHLADARAHLSFTACLHAWRAIHDPAGRSMCCLVLREGARMLAVLPMVTWRRGAWRVACPLGPGADEGADILAPPRAATVHAIALLRRFLAAAKPDLVELPGVRCDSLLDAALAGAAGLRRREGQAEDIPFATLRQETDWDSYCDRLSSAFGRQLRAQARGFHALGRVEYVALRGDGARYLPWLVRQRREHAGQDGSGAAWLPPPGHERYLDELCRNEPTMRVFVLLLDGAPVAVRVVCAGPGLCSLLIGAEDAAHAAYAPGTLLDRYWLHYVFENFRDRAGRHLDVDLGAGCTVDKLHWSRQQRIAARGLRLATSSWGALPWHLRAMMDRVRPATPGRAGPDQELGAAAK